MDVPAHIRTAEEDNAAALFDAAADRRATETAIEMDGRTMSYADLRDRSGRFAGRLADRGFDPGDRLLLYLPNCPEYVVGVLGGLRAGVVVSPVNPQYKARELAHQIEDSDAAGIITHSALRDHVSKACDDLGREPIVITVGEAGPDDVPFGAVEAEPLTRTRNRDDTAMQPYTSGTTGQPKGVLVTHGNLRAQAFSGFGFTDLPPDQQRELVVLPLYHITGFVHSTWQALIRGGTLHLRNPANWDPATAMEEIETHEITNFVAVAAMFVDMVNSDAFGEYDLSSLETVNQGGAKMPVAVQERFEETANVGMAEGYGLTETTAATHTGIGSSFGAKLGSIGQPLRMTDCKIVDEDGEEVGPGGTGELLVRGPQVMKGYHGRPEETEAAFTEAGYFRTGDVARRDEENYYEIVDRKKHMINTAGYNVYPSEVEELLFEHETVADAAVVGVPDERRNETVKAFVVPTSVASGGSSDEGTESSGVPTGADASEEELKEFCLSNLAEYKHPREVEFVSELPRTASGKVQKFKLVEGEEA